jgi:hypothetical protein
MLMETTYLFFLTSKLMLDARIHYVGVISQSP